jgi:GT2 family glycosyltransferase
MIDQDRWHLCVDQPHVFLAKAGGLEVSGWCFNELSIEPPEVGLQINGCFFLCEAGLPRPDVAAAFSTHEGAGVSGFAFRGWVPSGYGTVTIKARVKDGEWVVLRSLPFYGETGPCISRIDFPREDILPNGEFTVTGWALHSQEPIEELLLFQGDSSAKCHYGISRPDLAREFPNISGSAQSGFYALLRSSTPGPILLRARLASGRLAISKPGKILSANGETGRYLEQFDRELAQGLRVPCAKQPLVSIIIPVYNEIDVTLNCLNAIARNSGESAYEVIVVDDNSASHTQACLDRIRGIRLLRHNSNQGFLNSSNDGARIAKGDFLVMLNNDTEVTRGWLENLLRVFRLRPDAGLVGAKLVYPDGRLQEAGGIIWRDASGVNYGKGDHADKPEYNYLREVDYCSGACILVPKALFHELGGFDPIYAPAYYEDADLAFKVREAGRKVYYQPLTTLIHHEGHTSGTSTKSGVKSYQLVNQIKFRSKWEKRLSQHFEGSPVQIKLAKQRGVARRALVVDARVLCPDQDAGSLRMLKMLEILQDFGFQVTFAPYNAQRLSPYTDRMQELGIECLYDPFLRNFEALLVERSSEFDLIILSRAETAEKVLPICRAYAPQTPIIFDTVDLHFLRGQREAELEKDDEKRKRAAEMESLELELSSACDAVVVVSTEEIKILKKKLPRSRVALISMIHDIPSVIAPRSSRRDFLFVGGFEHTPNVDAMLWFCSEVMPPVLDRLPNATLHIIGSKMPESIRALASDHIVTHGYVERIEPFLESCLLSVAPLRFGAGVKGKITQSMSYGLPVVSTTIGAEGMYLEHEKNVLVADKAAAFAKHIIQLHHDPQLWHRLSKNGLKTIKQHFSMAAAKRNTQELLVQLQVLPSALQEKAAMGNRLSRGIRSR